METRKVLGPAPGWSEGRGFWQRSCNQRMGALVVLWNMGAVPLVGCLIFLLNIPFTDLQGGTASLLLRPVSSLDLDFSSN